MNKWVCLAVLLGVSAGVQAQHDVVVTFRKNLNISSYYEEAGVSQRTYLGDTNTVRVTSEKDNGATETEINSRWIILAVENIGKSLPPNTNKRPSRLQITMETPARYVAVHYLFESDRYSEAPPAPRLLGTKKEIVCAMDKYDLRYYLPDGSVLGGGADQIPAKSMQKCWALYELGENIEIESVEIFPTVMSKYRISDVRDERIKGKRVYLSAKPSEKPGAPGKPSQPGQGSGQAQQKSPLILSGVPAYKLSTVGENLKNRYITCRFDVRTAQDAPQTATAKIYFIAEAKNGKQGYIYNIKEIEKVVEPSRLVPFEEKSDPVDEYDTFYFNKTAIQNIKPKGVIIQVYCEDKLMFGWSSNSLLNKYKDSPDIVGQMGKLKRSRFE